MSTEKIGRRGRYAGYTLIAVVLQATTLLAAQEQGPPQNVPLPVLPEVRSPFVLEAVNDPVSGKAAFSYKGAEVPPVIRVSPGQKIRLTYFNHMSNSSKEICVDGPCMNMTNLHFHGLHVSPQAPQDDVITMMANPGQSIRYTVDVPKDQPSGLYWYHTHPHGESYQQSLDGMSGAIVVEGIDRYIPEVRSMRERILVLRDAELKSNDVLSNSLEKAVQLSSSPCGAASGAPARVFTVNGVIRPQITIAEGEQQIWRIVNASPDLYADLAIDGQTLKIVALDGMPLGYHDPRRRTEQVQHILVAPAGRVEAIITGPRAGTQLPLRSLCVDTGADGDPNPEMTIADVNVTDNAEHLSPHAVRRGPVGAPVIHAIAQSNLRDLEDGPSQFAVNFTEDKKGFYINDKKYVPSDGPMVTVKVGRYVRWTVVNKTREIHPFHIHQVHFLVYAEDGKRVNNPEWLDTVNLNPGQSVDLLMDFTDPLIRGMSVFHCHLLKHEDKGMMAKILFR
jgi:suppressor of ftsI